jgi:hypothetical protein
MSMIEPNLPSLLWFTLLWTLCCVGFLVLSGSFPLKAAIERGRASSVGLAVFNAGLMVVLAGATLAFGYLELRVTSLVVVAGLVFLFAPTPFEAWPERWRDGRAVLAALMVVQLGTLAVLYHLGGGLLDRFV